MILNIPTGIKNLLILMALGYVGQMAMDNLGYSWNMFALHYPDNPFFNAWQIITYMLCHSGFGHLFFNAFALFTFGSVVEYRLGTKRMLQLFIASGLGAVALSYIASAIIIHQGTGTFTPIHDNGVMAWNSIVSEVNDAVKLYEQKGITIPVEKWKYSLVMPSVGASGAIYGIMIAFAVLFPNETLMFMFIPYPIKAKYIVPGIVAIDVIFGVLNLPSDPFGHSAHIGGALTGFIMIWIWRKKHGRF